MFKIEVADKEITECKTAKSAMRMTLVRSGKTLYEVAYDLGITESHLSRMTRCFNS